MINVDEAFIFGGYRGFVVVPRELFQRNGLLLRCADVKYAHVLESSIVGNEIYAIMK